MVKTPLRAVVVGLIVVSAVYQVSDGPAAFDAFRSLATLLGERRARTAEVCLASAFQEASPIGVAAFSAECAKATAKG